MLPYYTTYISYSVLYKMPPYHTKPLLLIIFLTVFYIKDLPTILNF